MRYKNRFTGETFDAKNGMFSKWEKSQWRLKKRIADFERMVKGEDYQVSFLTVTESDVVATGGYAWIVDLMSSMRKMFERRHVELKYLAVLELQEKRYVKWGVIAPHWHIVVATNAVDAFPHARREERKIVKERNGSIIDWRWLNVNIRQRLGMYFVCDAYSKNIYNYLGKYIAKGSDIELLTQKAGRRVRMFSASRIPVKYQMTEGQAGEFQKLVQGSPESEELYWRREDSKIVARAKHVEIKNFVSSVPVSVGSISQMGLDGKSVAVKVERENVVTEIKKVRYPKVHVIKSDWQFEE